MIHGKIAPDPAPTLIRALLELSNGTARFVQHRGTNWASATFTGMRHVLELSFNGCEAMEKGDHISQILADHEFAIAGHIVADITVSEIYRRHEGDPFLTMKIEALTVEDC